MTNENLDDTTWEEDATKAIVNLAHRYREFTADDVWAELRKIRPGTSLLDPRIMGGVMVRAQRNFVIKASGRYTRSKSDANHHRPILIWESLVYKEAMPLSRNSGTHNHGNAP